MNSSNKYLFKIVQQIRNVEKLSIAKIAWHKSHRIMSNLNGYTQWLNNAPLGDLSHVTGFNQNFSK